MKYFWQKISQNRGMFLNDISWLRRTPWILPLFPKTFFLFCINNICYRNKMFLKYNQNSKLTYQVFSLRLYIFRFQDKFSVLAQTFMNVLKGVEKKKKKKERNIVAKTYEAFFLKHDCWLFYLLNMMLPCLQYINTLIHFCHLYPIENMSLPIHPENIIMKRA